MMDVANGLAAGTATTVGRPMLAHAFWIIHEFTHEKESPSVGLY